MKSRLLGGALLLLAGITVWMVVSRDDTPPALQDPAVEASPEPPSGLAARVEPNPTKGEQGSERTTILDPIDNSWVVRGEVMHGSVAPLPAAHFEAQLLSGSQAEGGLLHETELISDANGGFAWALPAPRTTVTVKFGQSRPDTKIMADARIVLVDDNPPQDLAVFAFLLDCQVTGTVTDEAREPIAGSWVKGGNRDVPGPCNDAQHLPGAGPSRAVRPRHCSVDGRQRDPLRTAYRQHRHLRIGLVRVSA